MKKSSKSAYLVIAHGSRSAKSNEDFEIFLKRFREANPTRFVQGSFLELAKPSVEEGIELCVKQGALEIFVIPLMFFSGRHVAQDIPSIVAKAREAHPDLDFHYAGPLADNPIMLDVLESQAKHVTRSL